MELRTVPVLTRRAYYSSIPYPEDVDHLIEGSGSTKIETSAYVTTDDVIQQELRHFFMEERAFQPSKHIPAGQR
jgi:hypothetical protein